MSRFVTNITLKIVKRKYKFFDMSCVTLIVGFLVSLRLVILEDLSCVTLIIALRLLESEE